MIVPKAYKPAILGPRLGAKESSGSSAILKIKMRRRLGHWVNISTKWRSNNEPNAILGAF